MLIHNENMDRGKISVTGSYCNASSLVVDGGSKILSPYSNEVKAISIPSGELMGVFRRHESVVTCIRLLESSQAMDTAHHVVSASKDGRIFVWRWTDFQVLREVNVGMEVHGFIVPSFAAYTSVKNGNGSSAVQSENGVLTSFKHDLYLLASKSSKSEIEESSRKGSIREASNRQLKLVLYDVEASKIRKKIASVNSSLCLETMKIHETDHLVVASKRKVFFISTKTRHGPKFLSKSGNVTCLASHEEKGLLITGHEHGEISMWHDIPHWMQGAVAFSSSSSSRKKKKKQKGEVNGDDDTSVLQPPVMTTLHWHAHAVRCLSFSSDGGYCYSGGEEGVLVMWQLATGIRSFVPRMGGTVAHVSADCRWGTMKVAVTTLDNSVHLVDVARMREEWSVQSLLTGVSGGSSGSMNEDKISDTSQMESIPWAVQKFRQRVRRDPVHGFLVSNGAPGRLQAVDPYTRGMRWSHEVLQYTRVSRTERHLKIYAPAVLDVVHHATAGGTVYMATTDARRGEDKMIVYSLKFWVWDKVKAVYCLSAQVEEPHGVSRVTCMSFIPSDPRVQSSPPTTTAREVATSGQRCIDHLVTGADDGSVKVWRAVESYNQDDRTNQVSWTCAFTFRHKENAVAALALSADGSLLALAQQGVVSFFSPLTVTFKSSLTVLRTDRISFVAFVEPRFSMGTGEAYMLIGSPTKLCLVNLLTMTTVWEKMPSSNEKFLDFAVASRLEDAMFFGDEDEEDAEAIDDGTLSRTKRGCVVASETSGKVGIYAIEGMTELAEFLLQDRAVGLLCGTLKSEGDSLVEVPGVYCITPDGLSFLSNRADAGPQIKNVKNKVLLGKIAAVVSQSRAAPLEVYGQSIADPSYSHVDDMEVEDNAGAGYSRDNTDASVDTRALSTKSLPPVSSLVADFFGAHLRRAHETARIANGNSPSFSSSHDMVALPGNDNLLGAGQIGRNSSSSSRHRLSTSSTTSGLPIETDSSSDEDNEREESRVNMKRRRSSSLDNYYGAVTSVERDSHEFVKARTSGSFQLSF